ncbi:dTMP kinase [Desulfolucanica intricata]|uniref:dTMP kinase n=1 Tax=Desulfolucanica intricata TaxID=1285191 RepID=UPI000830CD2D|nr:dTMP kinase [Desulfolucanica intricata]
MSGLFIVFEGIDGSGKTTQINLLKDNLFNLGYQVVLTREPGGTRISELIRDVLLNPDNKDLYAGAEALLYAAARSQHIEEKIKPALSMGKIVLCDRFTDSTLAYQGYGRGQDLNYLQKLNHLATGGLQPDLTFLLDLPVQESLERLNRRISIDRLEQENMVFYERVRSGYLKISCQNQNYYVMDARLEPRQLSREVLGIVEEYL